MMQPRLIAALALVLAAPLALGEETAKLVPSADGLELLDASAGLAWSRCVQGMHWDGRHCTGEPTLATHAEALALARTRSEAEGRPWRVPRAQELRRLPERLGQPRHAAALMPDAPRGWHWSSTVRIETESVNAYSYGNVQRGATERHVDRLAPQAGWAVDQPGGAVREMRKRERLPVRLVRPLAP
ncbi:hypothetical protein J2X16_002845 [Pelomonas aquatica]|uniref:Lcl C-terminal domain-containing protein n=1 Tax=Pelomonas aquatica TaxID=431058 RepID=A0ABU1ZBT9_9BURK|nr:DUF1566 domain-containing protein [Pelomonas aquatica]MDR7297496.1 hypothetical protein [Pelomonas aquatica]